MKKFVVILLCLPLYWSGAEEATPVLAQQPDPTTGRIEKPKEESPKEVWLGVSVEKPSEGMVAHLVGVPQGVGFSVKGVNPVGPAAQAGLRSYDLLWKMGDQLLVNEAQFLTLLSLHEIGEKVTFTYQRQGRNIETEIELKARPQGRVNGLSEVEHIVTMLPIPGLPRMVISDQERFAELEDRLGKVVVTKRAENFHWQAWGPEGEEINAGTLGMPDERGVVSFPEEFDPVLKNKLSALIRAYEHSAGRGRGAPRLPRVRRVPTAQ